MEPVRGGVKKSKKATDSTGKAPLPGRSILIGFIYIGELFYREYKKDKTTRERK